MQPSKKQADFSPTETLKPLSFFQNAELFFYAGNRLLISIERAFLVFGAFLLVFLVLYPMAHRFEILARFFGIFAGTEDGFRKTFFEKSEWAIELSKFALLWVSMIGGALATAYHRHITIDVVTKFLSPRVKALFSLLSAIIAGIFCFWLFLASLNYVLKDMSAEIKTTTMQIPIWWVKVIFPLGFLIFVYHYWVSILEDFRGLCTGNFEYLMLFREGKGVEDTTEKSKIPESTSNTRSEPIEGGTS